MKKIDIKGQKFSYLTALEESKRRDFYVFRCTCGNIVEKRKRDVIYGKTTNCGCMRSKLITESKTTHGQSKTKLYWIWSSMKGRCYNKNDKSYKNYGMRGISVCEEWKNNFAEFKNWSVKNHYKEGLSIERIDNNGNYCPENCKWINLAEQARNKQKTIKVKYKNEEFLFIDLCKKYGIKYRLALDRYNKGYSLNEIFDTNADFYREKAHFDYFTYNGETKCLSEWCRIFNIKYCTAWARLFKYNKTFEETFGLK